ncbi:MAG: hypothetical protein GY797_18865 [Deltaproteobacteria bacterium]|nr:hypothetical protein [Deltaproteobacteria bacterium]
MINQSKFFTAITDATPFHFKGYNLLKLFYSKQLTAAVFSKQEGWKVDPQSKIVKAWHLFWQGLILFIKAYQLGRLKDNMLPILFYGASGRHFEIDGATYDPYNTNIVGVWERQQVVILERKDTGIAKQYPANLYMEGLHFWGVILCHLLTWFPVANNFQVFGRRLAAAFPHLNLTPSQSARIVAGFYSKFLLYGILLDLLKPSQIILICHYSKEAFIAACKARNIPVTELMHGIITPHHPQYNFPAADRALMGNHLFPDRLLVYGEYWKNVVAKGHFLPWSQIQIIGYYLKVPPIPDKKPINDKTILLITGQPTVQNALITYLMFLKQNLDPDTWQIIIKPHPKENAAGYVHLVEKDFVRVTMANTYNLLTQTDIHIGVYSSVVFEASRYSLSNYTLLVEPYLAHCREIVESGVARPLQPNELPQNYQPNPTLANHYFAPFNPTVL